MGSSVPGDTHRWTLVLRGKDAPYQLSGASSCIHNDQVFSERPVKKESATPPGQSNRSLCKIWVGSLHVRDILVSAQYNVVTDSESRVMKNDCSNWMLNPEVFQQILVRIPSLYMSFFCIPSDFKVLQLEARSSGKGYRCLFTELEDPVRVRKTLHGAW